MARNADDLPARLAKIKLLALDVDGVMTDGGIIYPEDQTEPKVFFVRDGFAIRTWTNLGLRAAVITGRGSTSVVRRCRELGIGPVIVGAKDKAVAFRELLKQTGVSAAEVAAVGDDLPDLPVLLAAGVSAAVADAVPEVKAAADFVAKNPGGRGAVRETIEWILGANGRWAEVVAKYREPA
jgi:3-deoxy-D-manno-octulosonate 8-phosphate phosphatase (KDO 8-P phosphatase)